MTTTPRRPSTTPGTRRSRRPAPTTGTFLERNRTRLLVAGGTVGIVLLAGLIFLNSSSPAYACTNLFDPTPAPTQAAPQTRAPGESGPPATQAPAGFVQPDMGHLHVPNGDRVRYTNCPPASGKHYNTPGGPIRGGVYGPDERTAPQGWIHNLEHGAVVLLYKCPGPACEPAGQEALEALLARWPNSPVCKTPPGTTTPIFTRFDEMSSPYAVLVWNVVLPLQSLDEAAILAFYAGWGERFNPEPQCAAPTPTPGPTPTAGPSATVAPSPSVAPTGTAAPQGSAAPSSSAAPASSAAPTAS